MMIDFVRCYLLQTLCYHGCRMCSIVGVRIIFRALGRNYRKIIIQAIVLGRDIEYEAELAEAVR